MTFEKEETCCLCCSQKDNNVHWAEELLEQAYFDEEVEVSIAAAE